MSNWICEFCYKPATGDLPSSWDLVWQSAVCPDCQEKVAQVGGYGKVLGGQFADVKDPREVYTNEECENNDKDH